jgi:tRNA(Arg) A34 adenosine deaminase TadA
MNGFTFDPTAHGERQMIDWYFDQIAQGFPMPPPSQLSIVTSLDPCCMCAGSILTAGFNVTVGRTCCVASSKRTSYNFCLRDTHCLGSAASLASLSLAQPS